MAGDRWLSAEEATARLGVSRQTLYAYVSRSRVGAIAAPGDPRRSLYDAADISRLLENNRRGRSRRAVAASTISWGEPVLASRITRIEGGRIEYRSQDAIALSSTATLEHVAALLWETAALPPLPAGPEKRQAISREPAALRCIEAVAEMAMLGRWSGRLDGVLPDAVQLVAGMAAAAAGHPVRSSRDRTSMPVHQRLAAAWEASPKAADLIRRALVLVADHELNASTYAARVVASTRAPLGACMLAGLAALMGPLHGGMTDEVRILVDDSGMADDPAALVAARLARGESIPGFGQHLYPDGDPRAKALLERMTLPVRWRNLINPVEVMTGLAPNVDFALLALEHRNRLPRGSAFAIFAVGRSVGWIAHALEQWREGALIRPRAVYPEVSACSDSDPCP